jgi:hypothetical protein
MSAVTMAVPFLPRMGDFVSYGLVELRDQNSMVGFVRYKDEI